VAGTGLLRTQVENALAELVALGRASSDSFAGLRALLVPSSERPRRDGRRRTRRAIYRIDEAGRWVRVERQAASPQPEALETIARVLLRRWGVVFRKLLDREGELPPWRDLLRVYRRLEARGEIRGGRFVAGFSGEQYALPDAVGALREMRRAAPTGEWVTVSGADPLNLAGIVTPGARLPALASNRILYRDGVPLAVREAGEIRILTPLDPATDWAVRQTLVRRAGLRATLNTRQNAMRHHAS